MDHTKTTLPERLEKFKRENPKDHFRLIFCKSVGVNAIQIMTNDGLWTCLEHENDLEEI